MSRPLAVGFALALVLLSVLAPVGASATPGELQLSAQEFDRTEFAINVHANGTAEWTFTYQQTLANETERQRFREFADRFNSQETQLYTDFRNRSQALVADGQQTTGREMTATGFTKEAYVNQLGNQGIVEMSFRWTGFAVVDGDRVIVGDVFEGGLYIGPSQRLVIGHGDDLVFSQVDPDPDATAGGTLRESDTVTWNGERSFSDNRPRVVLTEATATPTPGTGGETPTDPQPTTTTAGTTGGDGFGLLPIVALLVVLLVGAVGVAYRAGVFDDDGDAAAAAASGDNSDGGDGGTDDEAEPAISDEELMSDEDRVRSMLEDRGGRMKQVNIVEETGWSKSKVSMLLSEMEEAGDISKLRVGRENIISLSGHEPDAAKSPFDDEE